MKNKEKYTVAGFFAGVGGIEKGFKDAGFDPIWANEIDLSASITFTLNNPRTKLVTRDINEVSHEEVPDVDVIVGGFPCQAFSVAGYRRGFNDPRGEVFFNLAKIIDYKRPKAILLENVKNLRTHDKGKTFEVITQTLRSLGYSVEARVLNASEYGNIPQNRERIYIVAFQDHLAFDSFEWPNAIKLTKNIHDCFDSDLRVDDRFYYTESFPHIDQLREEMDDPYTVYQWRRQYVRKNQSRQFPTLTANMGTGGHNVPLVITRHGIRKLTPQECFRVQGYEDIKLPKIALSHLYKQAGNSVVVPVVERIARQMRSAMETSDRQFKLDRVSVVA